MTVFIPKEDHLHPLSGGSFPEVEKGTPHHPLCIEAIGQFVARRKAVTFAAAIA